MIYCENSQDVNFANKLAEALRGHLIFSAPSPLAIKNFVQIDIVDPVTFHGTQLGLGPIGFVYYFSHFPSYAYFHDGGDESSQIIIKGYNPINCWPLPPSECYRVLNHL